MMQLQASKTSMMKLIRDYRNLMEAVIPLPAHKERTFRKREDGSYVMSWQKWKQSFRFILTNNILRPLLIVEIFEEGALAHRDFFPLDRADLRKRGILVDGREEP